ncbi:hypothetical protein FSARC_6270 [Fusarium sarcochroum]|uniref:Extracellular membrane protein CFEM domain-containing protein n=1 Tax=Fusarium sarcochroum TaxID=1208366 RepID=A0A8H4TY06_9HYPO|nr:hypothetical protein FSARC_6270 [Fusarium sarcochroum]
MILQRSIVLLFISHALAIESSFAFYPKGAQSCLNKSAKDAGCTGSDVQELNQCLCGLQDDNQDFIFRSAKCIGRSSPDDLDKTYDTMATACDNSGTPITVTKKQFQAAAKNERTSTTLTTGTSTTSSSTTAASSTSTSDEHTTTGVPASATSNSISDDNHNITKSGLSTGAFAGIVVAACVGGIALIGTIIHCVIKQRRGTGTEPHPTLPNYENLQRHESPMAFSPIQDLSMSRPRISSPSLPTDFGLPMDGRGYHPLQQQTTSYDGVSNGWNLHEMDGSCHSTYR